MSSKNKKRILFIENRSKTLFWEKVAAELITAGFEVHFLVQNPIFRPKNFNNVHLISIPNKKKIEATKNQVPEELKSYLEHRDRGFRFFNSDGNHYGYYHQNIKQLLIKLSPDLVVGECTLFHELIAIYLCEKLSINFVHPTGTRYPPQRFQIFNGDKQKVAVSSGDSWPISEIDNFLSKVNFGKVSPAYMKKRTSIYQRLRFNFYRLYSWLLVFFGFLRGERFNTPSLLQKLKLSNDLRKCKNNWNKVCSLPAGNKNILYLMQMQPEANLDVWGAPFSDQVSVIKELASVLPEDFNVIVKANPKAKYELLGFLDALKSYTNIYFAPTNLTMKDIKSKQYGILTVTGTIGLESVFNNGNCISLAHPILSSRFPKYSASSISDAVAKLLETKCETSEDNEARDLLSVLISDSFTGVIGDPLYFHNAFDKENISKVASGIAKCI